MVCILLMQKNQISTMVYLSIYLLLSLAISFFSLNKRVGFVEILYISLFLTPIVGLVSVLKADNNIITRHYSSNNNCPSCGLGNSKSKNICSDCGYELNILNSEEFKLNHA